MRRPVVIWRVLRTALALLAMVALTLPAAPVARAQGGYAESFVLTGLVE